MKLEDVILRDDRASQPAATDVSAGTIYHVTDEKVTERSNGTAWEDISDVTDTSGSAPNDEDYLVKTSTGGLSAERVVTDTTSIVWDWTVGGQAKATRAALTGDVTAGADSNATTIANDAVTYAKMQNVSTTDRLLGRDGAAPGDVEELTVGNGLEFTGAGGIGVANAGVTYARIQDVSAASRLLGRGSAGGSGDVEEITLGAGLSMSGTALSASSAVATRTFGICINGGGAEPATGIHGEIRVPFSGTITKVTLLADQAGDAVIDIWNDDLASYPPDDTDSITSASPPTLTTDLYYEDSTLSGWITTVTAGDVFRFNLDSVDACTRLTLIVEVTV